MKFPIWLWMNLFAFGPNICDLLIEIQHVSYIPHLILSVLWIIVQNIAIYLLKSKDKVIEKFIIYKQKVKNQLNKKSRCWIVIKLWSMMLYFVNFVLNVESYMRSPCLSPHTNEVPKRKNWKLEEMMNPMLVSYGLPQNFWGKLV